MQQKMEEKLKRHDKSILIAHETDMKEFINHFVSYNRTMYTHPGIPYNK